MPSALETSEIREDYGGGVTNGIKRKMRDTTKDPVVRRLKPRHRTRTPPPTPRRLDPYLGSRWVNRGREERGREKRGGVEGRGEYK